MPPVRIGVWAKLELVLGLGSEQTIVPKENSPTVRVRVWAMVSFGVEDNFPRRQLS